MSITDMLRFMVMKTIESSDLQKKNTLEQLDTLKTSEVKEKENKHIQNVGLMSFF